MQPGYRTPDLPHDVRVVDLVPEDATMNRLEPTTTVTCLNRGRRELKDKFDGRDYPIPVGYFRCPYGAAKHFQTRQIVPGSRDPDNLFHAVSFIAILGVDPKESCVPFTDEEIDRMEGAVEGLDRKGMVLPSDRQARAMPLRRSSAGRGSTLGGMRPRLDASQQGSPEAAARAAEAFVPSGQPSAAERDEAAAGRGTPAPAAAPTGGAKTGGGLKAARDRVAAE